MIKVACVQCDVVFGDPEANARKAVEDLVSLKKGGVDLAIYPEAYLTGYCFDTALGARKGAIAADSAPLQSIRQAAEHSDIMAIVGFAEVDGDKLYNSAAIFEPGKEPVIYRKSHLPCLGLDNFVNEGEGPLRVLDTRIGKIGVLICFDMRMPEATRALALQGAQLLVLPTNWPEGAEVTADYIAVARAWENRIFVATCDRVGTENGFKFIGKSKIVDVSGKVLAAAGDSEETIVAELDLTLANQKRIVTIPGRYEVEVFKARRPELYLDLTRDLEG
jgi:5-aminopentanamidase